MYMDRPADDTAGGIRKSILMDRKVRRSAKTTPFHSTILYCIETIQPREYKMNEDHSNAHDTYRILHSPYCANDATI